MSVVLIALFFLRISTVVPREGIKLEVYALRAFPCSHIMVAMYLYQKD
jgi:hypothetical protein